MHIKDELARLPGISEVLVCSASAITACGSGSIPANWRRCGLTVGDVVAAMREQNLQVAAGQIGQPPTTGGADRGSCRSPSSAG